MKANGNVQTEWMGAATLSEKWSQCESPLKSISSVGSRAWLSFKKFQLIFKLKKWLKFNFLLNSYFLISIAKQAK